ncbi:MAG TPA: hypothetical protein VIG69_03980, partial [Candidatus Methylomirabilis sp.]
EGNASQFEIAGTFRRGLPLRAGRWGWQEEAPGRGLRWAGPLPHAFGGILSSADGAENDILGTLCYNVFGCFSEEVPMPSPTTTLRLRPTLRSQIARLARRHRRSFSEVTQDLLEEALRLRACPGIYFADEPAGRVAKVMGTGLGVWEVTRDYLELDRNEAALRKLLPHLSGAQVRVCLIYYAKYPDEIDDAIQENREVTRETVEAALPTVIRSA